jgi:hypothetical protein
MQLRFTCLMLLVSLAADPSEATEHGPVQLVAQPILAADLAALPRIAEPDGPASQRINDALAKADARVREAATQCHADALESHTDSKGGEWQRSVTVAMRGAGYLALVASDNWYCGGAYPDAGQFSLAYDMRTGAPLNWERLLPKALVGTASLDTAGDGTRLGVVASPALKALYLNLLKPDADCGSALKEADLQFMLWPDAAREGIAMAPSGLPHVIAACGDDAVIPVKTLHILGVASGLVDAITAAHVAGLFGAAP